MVAAVSENYLLGINEGRQSLARLGLAAAPAVLDNLRRTIKGFASDTPVGQALRGERDFWLNQVRKERKS